MLNEKDTGAKIAEPDPNHRFFSDEPEEMFLDNGEPEQVDETDEDDIEDPEDEESEVEQQPAKPKDKFDGKDIDEIKEAYRNLEALYGKQAQELGDAKKPIATKPEEWTPDRIPEFPDEVLDGFIQSYANYLNTPDKALDDSENFGRITAEYGQLILEKSMRNSLQHNKKTQVTESNTLTKLEYTKSKYLSETELDQIANYALTKLSDNGELTKSDLDVAMHKLFPDKWVKASVDKDIKRIADAQTRKTPMLTPNGADSVTGNLKSLKEINSMDSYAYDRYLDTLSPSELTELQKKINKG